MARHHIPTEERADVPMHADLRALLLREAERHGRGIGEHIVHVLCEHYGHPLDRGLRPRKPPGRKPKPVSDKPAAKRRRK